MAFCKTCGKELKEDAIVCLSCGCAVPKGKGVNPNSSSKSKVIAGLLQLFLGTLGIGRFYLGHKKIAIPQLVLTLVSLLLLLTLGLNPLLDFLEVYFDLLFASSPPTGEQFNSLIEGVFIISICNIPATISGIWSFVDAIVIFCSKNLKDGHGKIVE